MLLGFMTPEIIEEYVKEAVVFEPTSISIPDFTSNGVQTRVEGKFRLDGSRVSRKSVRDLGRFGTWIAREVETSETDVEVYLPEYGNVVLGTAKVPSIKVSIRDGHVTPIDFLAELVPGPPDGIRQLADEWMRGRLGQLRVRGKAQVSLQSGILHLTKQTITHTILIDDSQVPKLPHYEISRLNVHQLEMPDGDKGLAVDVSVLVENDYPVDLSIPPLGFGILVDNCMPTDPHIMVADALTERLQIKPKQDIQLNVTGSVRRLPSELTNACPDSKKSPLDALLGNYIHGDDTTIYVRGSDSPSPDTPRWIAEILSDITVPVSLAGRTFEHLIRNFSLTDVHFKLPDPFAEPDSDDAQPKVSAKIKALINLPEEMNFPVDVSRVRANADVFYEKKKLGVLDLHKWQQANSTRVSIHGKPVGLEVESLVEDAPLKITNSDLFTEVIQKLLFGGKGILLAIKADVDVELETDLGTIRVQQIPAEGVVPVKPMRGGNGNPGRGRNPFGALAPQIGNLSILQTTPTSLTIRAEVNFTNPTNYSATVPYIDINLLVNDTVLGHGTVRDVTIVPGNNSKVPVIATYDPTSASGEKGRAIGREMISQYLSGFNTTLSLRAHEESIPSQPALGKALSALKLIFAAPRLHTPSDPNTPDDPDASSGKFIRSATMHLFSSTAIFSLASPLLHNTLYVTFLNATAFYKGDVVGRILNEDMFAVPPGFSETPRLPVAWSLGSVGYDAIRKAVGGQLHLSAMADVGVKLGQWEEGIWFKGKGIGAKVRL
ncbi:hypothetical protein NA57DRAFT_37428 [Rhizodiscina lignyota]|uniref:Pre-rRNA processing protein n=1 Tax=Rhizodiscina lignyota TaxID=1504668 RepID=A0A9P4IFM2_9PEZI|nr:hypothetical protein NA57DRAFT_37428 [Rhizodiscina lignyota]